MENALGYICMGLVFMVYMLTMLVDCERFEELKISEVRKGLAKTFLRMRRMRVVAGVGLYGSCCLLDVWYSSGKCVLHVGSN